MICFPLDNTEYTAAALGSWMATRTRGVFSGEGNLAVTANNNMTVNVSPGLAWLKASDYWGVAVLQEQSLTLALDTADRNHNRYDVVACRLDKVNNRAEIVIKKGSAASQPMIWDPVRNSNYDEIYLATILVRAGAVQITTADINDTRLNDHICGLMRDGVTGIPTAQLQAQATALISQLQSDLAGVKDHSGLMLMSDYAADAAGTVKNAEKLNGQPPSYYAPDYTAAAVKMPYNWIDGHAIYRRVITLVPSQMTEIEENLDTPAPTYRYDAPRALTGIDTILPDTCAMLYTGAGHAMPLGYVRMRERYDAGYGFLVSSSGGPNYDIALYTGQRQAADIPKVILIVYYTAV